MPADPNGLNSSLEELNDFVESEERRVDAATEQQLKELREKLRGVDMTPEPENHDAGPENYIPIVEGIPPQFESQFYRMNRKTVDLLVNGSMLKDGMIVLIEDHLVRENLERAFARNDETHQVVDQYALRRAEINNRWCRVSDVRTQGDHGQRQVIFVAEYADGTKVKRTYSVSYAWYVTIDSLFG